MGLGVYGFVALWVCGVMGLCGYGIMGVGFVLRVLGAALEEGKFKAMGCKGGMVFWGYDV